MKAHYRRGGLGDRQCKNALETCLQELLAPIRERRATYIQDKGMLLTLPLVDAVAGLSFLTHFQAITRGVLDLRDVVFFLLCIGAWLLATVLVIDLKKAD